MARVEISSTSWGVIWKRGASGSVTLPFNTSVNVNNLNGSAATHWSSITGGTSSTATLVTTADGIPSLDNVNVRYIEEGTYNIVVLGVSRRVEAVAASSVISSQTLVENVDYHLMNGAAASIGTDAFRVTRHGNAVFLRGSLLHAKAGYSVPYVFLTWVKAGVTQTIFPDTKTSAFTFFAYNAYGINTMMTSYPGGSDLHCWNERGDVAKGDLTEGALWDCWFGGQNLTVL